MSTGNENETEKDTKFGCLHCDRQTNTIVRSLAEDILTVLFSTQLLKIV